MPTSETSLPLCIIGAGGFGREVLCLYTDICRHEGKPYEGKVIFAENDAHWQERSVMGIPVLRLSAVQNQSYIFIIAIGDPRKRAQVAASMPADTQWATLVHPSVIKSDWVIADEGSIICAGSVLTCNIALGKHTHINLNTTVGHDVIAGDYFTTAPGVAISGNCCFGDCVYIGSNASIREEIAVADDVIIGMGAVVVKNITEPGTYASNPARKIS